MRMNWINNDNAEEFLKLNEGFLLQNESMNNLMLGLANALKNQRREALSPLFRTFLDNNEVKGQAMQTDSNLSLIHI